METGLGHEWEDVAVKGKVCREGGIGGQDGGKLGIKTFQQPRPVAREKLGVVLHMVSHPARSGNRHMKSPVMTLLDGVPTPRHHHGPQHHGLVHAHEVVPNLVGQRIGRQFLKYWKSKGSKS